MIAQYGSPTLFLTLSCAEYDSADIVQYLRKVNNAPQSYSISRLCTEDPVSVSRQFSYKFKDFFNIVILQRAK
uniref:Helitron helicase-like domain-containing protein n=1 Tax=Amphimedon queenslandica TaxID=400682 RepID=A0A1X7V782_AMPQE